MKTSQSQGKNGIGFAGALTLIFVTLKLCRVIDWSWWWVLSPVWLPVGIVLSLWAVIALIALSPLEETRQASIAMALLNYTTGVESQKSIGEIMGMLARAKSQATMLYESLRARNFSGLALPENAAA